MHRWYLDIKVNLKLGDISNPKIFDSHVFLDIRHKGGRLKTNRGSAKVRKCNQTFQGEKNR